MKLVPLRCTSSSSTSRPLAFQRSKRFHLTEDVKHNALYSWHANLFFYEVGGNAYMYSVYVLTEEAAQREHKLLKARGVNPTYHGKHYEEL